jgi:predicted house-cleaning noncanonical NTP pyrophosphatase (MazG superfamily)
MILKGVLFMCYREDYYKFVNQLVPEMVFNNGRLFIYRLLRNENMMITNLKKLWEKMKLEETYYRNEFPNIQIEEVQINVEHTLIIISIPEAREDQEAIYIGITYDRDDNFRYFTYEISKQTCDKERYSLYEITSNNEQINYGAHQVKDKAVFSKELSQVLIYELF